MECNSYFERDMMNFLTITKHRKHVLIVGGSTRIGERCVELMRLEEISVTVVDYKQHAMANVSIVLHKYAEYELRIKSVMHKLALVMPDRKYDLIFCVGDGWCEDQRFDYVYVDYFEKVKTCNNSSRLAIEIAKLYLIDGGTLCLSGLACSSHKTNRNYTQSTDRMLQLVTDLCNTDCGMPTDAVILAMLYISPHPRQHHFLPSQADIIGVADMLIDWAKGINVPSSSTVVCLMAKRGFYQW